MPLVLVFVVSLALYHATLSPTINSFDSAELVTAAHCLGIVHATGYPLYLLLGHAAALIPWGSIPRNVNLLSAIFGSLACCFTYLTCQRLNLKTWISVSAALLLAVSGTFWFHAVIAEVYTLTGFLVSVLIYVCLIWLQTDSRYAMWATFFIFGLSLTNHMSSVLLGPGLMVLAIRSFVKEKKVWPWLAAGLFTILPLSLYAYLPIRYLADPPLNYVGQYFDVSLATPAGVMWMVSGRMFGREMFGATLADGFINVLRLCFRLWLDLLGVGGILALLGIWRLWKREQWFSLFALSGIVCVLIFFGFYDVVDTETMTVPALVFLMPFVGVGWSTIHDAIQKYGNGLTPAVKQYAVPTSGILLVLIGGIVNWPYADHHTDYSSAVYANSLLDTVEPDALILTQWTSATPLLYMQIVEEQRPDVEILDRGFYMLGLRDRLIRAGQGDSFREVGRREMAQIIREALVERPVYLTEYDERLGETFCLIPLPLPEAPDTYQVFGAPPAGQICTSPPE